MQQCIAHDVDLSLPPAGEELWPDRTHAWRRLLVSLPPSCCSVVPVWAQQSPIPVTGVVPADEEATPTRAGETPGADQAEEVATATTTAEVAVAATAQTVVATTA
jgi:hypothetical protein